jgi:hypothetical protein
MSDEGEDKGFLYLLQLPNNTKKLGRSKCFVKRFEDYPEGTQAMFFIEVENVTKHETNILRIFKKLLLQRTDIGREYFQAPISKMKQIILKYLEFVSIFEESDFDFLISEDVSLVGELKEKDDCNHGSTYKCPRCKYETERAFNMKYHLNRKVPCDDIMKSNLSQKECLSLLEKDT